MRQVLYMYVPACIQLVFVCSMQYYIGICMNLYESVCISNVKADAGPRWHKRQRTGPAHDSGSESCDSDSESDPENVLYAARRWRRNETTKTENCMAAKLRCSVWARAQSPGTVSLSLTKGWTRLSEAKRGNLGIAMQDLAWTAGSDLPQPTLLAKHPILANLPNKLVHFILDYHPSWVARLQLPASDGRHRQLAPAHFHSALDRLENMTDVPGPLQLFSAVEISHRDWRGVQWIHAMPFNKEKQQMVQ